MPKCIVPGALGLLLAALVVMAPRADAADPGFCRQYAEAGVRQAETGYSTPRCRPGIGGPRWSTDFRVHYRWCLEVSHEAAGAERDIRRRHLDSCRH